MPVQITIRNVPDEVRDELKIRAARNRQSMQQFLLSELERMAEKPNMTNKEIIERARERLKNSNSSVTSEMIVESIRELRGPLPS